MKNDSSNDQQINKGESKSNMKNKHIEGEG